MLRHGKPRDKVEILGDTRLEQTREFAQVGPDDVVRAAQRIQADYTNALRRAA